MRIRSGVSRLRAFGDRSPSRANTPQLDVDLPGGTFIRNNGGTPNPGTPSAPNPFIGVPNPEYTGWYVEGSWFFGGHKTYEDEGTWGRPVVNNPMFHGSGGWGGWQIVGKV